MRNVMTFIVTLGLASYFSPEQAAAEWPMYDRDAAHSGVTAEQIKVPLHLQWVYVPRHGPQPAWPEPGEPNRLTFDHAYQVAAANGMVYFGSSADNKVYALDAATGRERWSFFTEGPVRFTPAVWDNRVFAASDDGWLYCLSAAEGKLLWKFRGGPRNDRMLGNGRMMSRWPLRGGVVVDEGVVYLVAGMWPAEGTYVWALGAEDGTVIWSNDTTGNMFRVGPHGGETISGVAPQGYLLLSKDILFVPTGRSVVAAFDRKTGRFLYYRVLENAKGSGSWARVSGSNIFCQATAGTWGVPDGIKSWDCRTGYVNSKFLLTGQQRVVVSGATFYATGNGKVSAFDLKDFLDDQPWSPPDAPYGEFDGRTTGYEAYQFIDRKPPKPGTGAKWEVPCNCPYELILAGNTLFAGGREAVAAVDIEQRKVVWTGMIRGEARGLAVADGKLFVSTSLGDIACFSATEQGKPATVRPPVTAAPYPPDELTPAYAALAEQIVKETGIRAGYCLDFGAGDGRLAYELAKRTRLKIYCLEPDAAKVAAARKALDAAGLYGVRVTVDQGSLKKLPYASYFADLIVSGGGLAEDLPNSLAKELYRVLRPCGGVAFLAPIAGRGAGAEKLVTWLRDAGVPKEEIRSSDAATRLIRGSLPGTGDWTHQYAEAGRSGCASDRLVKPPLEMLWFGGPGTTRVMNRGAGAGPVSANGRLFLLGDNQVMALNAYNGQELWARPLPQVGRLYVVNITSNLACDLDSVYVAVKDACLRLDASNGKDMQTYRLPLDDLKPEERPGHIWIYLARWKNLVLGSFGKKSDWTGNSRGLFALDRDSGQPLWVRHGLVPHNAIALEDNRLFLLERTEVADAAKPGKETLTLVALEVQTGRELWKIGDKLRRQDALLASGGVVLATDRGSFSGGAQGLSMMCAYSSRDGQLLWSRLASLLRTPTVAGDTVYERSFACDLRTGALKTRRHPLTGEEVPWSFRRSHGCGMLSATPTMLGFRSGTIGFYDLAGDSGVLSYGGIRPGCAVNMIAAGGVMLIPEGSAYCTCGLNYKSSLALVPAANREDHWSVFTESGGAGVVQHLALNLGAPGDRRDEEGKLWLGFPRPSTRRAMPVEASVDVIPGLGYFRRNPEGAGAAAGPRPWLYSSGCRGVKSINLRVDLTRRVVSLPCRQPPLIDGQLLDSCWDGNAPVAFIQDDAEWGPGQAAVFARYDADNLYLAFRREAKRYNFDERAWEALGLKGKILGSWTMRTKGQDAPVWYDDSWELFFSDEERTAGVHLGVSASGARYDARFLPGKADNEEVKWNGDWTSAVAVKKEEWTTELAVPWRLFAQAGLKRDNLAINIKGMSELGIPSLAHTLMLRPPGLRGWFPCERFAPLSLGKPAAAPRAYTVQLHFAEPDEVKPDQRVFDVKIQGALVLKDLDILKEAGGRNRALVREFKDIMAGDTVQIDLVPKTAQITPYTAPILNGLEIVEQRK